MTGIGTMVSTPCQINDHGDRLSLSNLPTSACFITHRRTRVLSPSESEIPLGETELEIRIRTLPESAGASLFSQFIPAAGIHILVREITVESSHPA